MWLGIDPGKSGAIAAVDGTGYAVAHDWPGDVSGAAKILSDILSKYSVSLAAIEKVHAMPKQGVVSMFSFGENYGQWQGILAALRIPFVTVTPQTWQKGLVDRKAGKAGALATARRLFPQIDLHRKKDHGRADALLIATWAASRSGGKIPVGRDFEDDEF